MKYAVVKIGSSQYKVAEGDEFDVEKLVGEKGDSVEFDEVLLYVNDNQLKIGQPVINGARVKAKIVDQHQGKKIRVATYKAKSRYRRVIGHRKKLTKIKISGISFSLPKETSKKPKKE